MDIDEFLDRELSDLSLDTDNAKQIEKNIEMPQFKEESEPSTLLEGIKANLSKGNLEQAEQAYSQLWRSLLQQNLNWNKELYSQLSILSRQFSSVLNQAYMEMKRKSEHIYELINRARISLKEGKKDLPFRLYAEVQEINNSIPNIFFEEKKSLQDQILSFYKELTNTTDNELIKKVSSLMQEIDQLVDKINNSIRSNDIASASSSYSKCIDLYNQVPEGFLTKKILSGMKLLEIYKGLSIHTEILNLQNQLGQRQFQHQYEYTAASKIIPKADVPQQTASSRASLKYAGKESQAASTLLSRKKEHAKKNIKKGFYNEAWKDIEEALQLEPSDVESKALRAKIKTLQ